MALDDLKEVIEKLQGVIKVYHDDDDYLSKKEWRTRHALINPLLEALGWEVSNPAAVQIEYQVKTKRADYVLIREGEDKPIAVIEAKGLGNSLEDDETTQAHIYANQAGIDYMIVTDGDTWKMFKAYGRGTLEERQIMEFQLSNDASHECALQALRMWNPNLASGSPKEAEEPVLERLVSKQDSADDVSNENEEKQTELPPSKRLKFTAFTFRDQEHKIGRDYEYLVKFSEILFQLFGDRFKKEVLEIRGPNGAVWFSEKEEDMIRPRLISGANIYAESNFRTTRVKKRVKELAELFDVEEPLLL